MVLCLFKFVLHWTLLECKEKMLATPLCPMSPASRIVAHQRSGRREATMTWPTQRGCYEAGDLTLQSGASLTSARLSWKAHGTLSQDRENVIIYPTSYGAQHPDLEWLIGPDKILDPGRWFIVIPDMFGNGLSSSPSNTEDYPTLVTIHDNVQVQRRALSAVFGIDRVACVYGWSMGALQAYHWAALFPDAVERIVVNCGVARTAVHNQVFLRSLMATLEAAPQHIG